MRRILAEESIYDVRNAGEHIQPLSKGDSITQVFVYCDMTALLAALIILIGFGSRKIFIPISPLDILELPAGRFTMRFLYRCRHAF